MPIVGEVWKPVIGYEGFYDVSNWGRVKSLNRSYLSPYGTRRRYDTCEKILKICPHPRDGHLQVHLYKHGVESCFYVHRLVLEAFVYPCPEGMEACHFPDPDPSNNRVENLRWDTRQSNIDDRAKHGTVARGERKSNSKLNDEKVLEILVLLQEGRSCREIATLYKISVSLVSAIGVGKRWTHVLRNL